MGILSSLSFSEQCGEGACFELKLKPFGHGEEDCSGFELQMSTFAVCVVRAVQICLSFAFGLNKQKKKGKTFFSVKTFVAN